MRPSFPNAVLSSKARKPITVNDLEQNFDMHAPEYETLLAIALDVLCHEVFPCQLIMVREVANELTVAQAEARLQGEDLTGTVWRSLSLPKAECKRGRQMWSYVNGVGRI